MKNLKTVSAQKDYKYVRAQYTLMAICLAVMGAVLIAVALFGQFS